MPTGNGGRRRVNRRRFMFRRVVAALALAAVVFALGNAVSALTNRDDDRVAHAEQQMRLAAANPAPESPVRPIGAATTTVTPAAMSTTAPDDRKPAVTAKLPVDSGTGKRVVYDISDQRVWLVEADDTVARTYRVSGSRYDQLDPATYQVFSRSRHATSWHGTESMEFMVRFHRGARSNIGFHDIPVNTSTGAQVQTVADLGTPLSDGCIRQDVVDAEALWTFAPLGTPVVVLR
jgi:lipoprotein-anchoring transpeptidase ErfK/SrfK